MIVGWDIGAANIKAARWNCGKALGDEAFVASQAFEIWRHKQDLPKVLLEVWGAVRGAADPHTAAITMTAELSDAFLTKREGVLYVLSCFKTAFPEVKTFVFSLAGEFVSLEDAGLRPLDFAASNWMATAQWVARQMSDGLVIDTGSTTTDIMPIIDGRVAALGRTDLDRLLAGELVYTGALRTNLAAIAPAVPVSARFCPVASEYFAISGDIHLILGNLQVDEYHCPTPDSESVSIDSARRRIARLVCADMEALEAAQIDGIARYLAACQVRQIQTGIEQVVARLPQLRRHSVVVLGAGSFLAKAAAEKAGLDIGTIPGNLGKKESAVAPSLAVAQLLARHLSRELA